MKNDWLYIIAISLMISSIVIGISYSYFYINNRECMENPLSYGARYYSNLYGEEFVGSGSFIREGNSPIIYFNSEKIYTDNAYINRSASPYQQ